jgi:mannosyltransferase
MITFDGIIYSLRSKLGGVAVYFRELVRQAALHGEAMQLLLHDPALAAAEFGCAPQQLHCRSTRTLERYRSIPALPPGLLHSSYYRSSVRRDMGNVITVYDFTYEKYASGPAALVHTAQKRRAIARADAVLCISENTRRDLLEFAPRFPADRAFVTHLAASEEFTPLADAGIPQSRPFVLFVSGRSTYKNFGAAVEAIRLEGSLGLLCVGGGPFTPAERTLLEARLPGRYAHAGRVDTAGLNRLYNSAVCLLYPSLYEGFGIPPLEAMRAGCPFIALNTSSLPEVAGDAGILLEESGPEPMMQAIRQCMEPSRRAELLALGLVQAGKFSWSRTFAQTQPVYRGLSR